METTSKNKIHIKNIVIAILFFAIGFIFSKFTIFIHDNGKSPGRDLTLFWEVWQSMEEYYPFEEPQNKDKMYSAIEGLVQSYGDDYSRFYPPVESEFFAQTIAGTFAGIGAEIITRKGFLMIVAPLKNSPSEKAGVKTGDIITHVDGIDISGDTLDQAISKIRGPIDTDVTLTIYRIGEDNNKTIDISITRDTVIIPVLETEIKEDVFIVHLYNFNNSAESEFEKAMIEFKESGLNKLVLDLRNNPGGFLETSINIASYFLPQGSVILIEELGDTIEDKIYRSKGYDLLRGLNPEIIILQNGGSASASEIIAGALRDNGVASIVGEQSFGKGSVQQLIGLSEDTALKVTIARWLTPKNNQISKIGITPDVEIDPDYDSIEDIQLQETLKLFN
jgi:carboxyl-terminal processing protease